MVEKSWRLQIKLRGNLVSVTSPMILRKSTSLGFSIKWNFYELNKTHWLACLTGHKYMWDMCVIPQVLFSFFSKYTWNCYCQVQKSFVLSFFWPCQLALLLLIPLCSPNWSWTDCADQTSLEIKVLLPQHQQGWDYRCEPTILFSISFVMRKKCLKGWCAVGCGPMN